MTLTFKSRIALVTGASRGIGRQICLDLSESGHFVIGVARESPSLDSLGEVLANSPAGGEVIALDLDSQSASSDLVRLVRREVGILVHNVGGNLGLTDPLGSSQEFLRVISHNIALSIDLNSHFIPRMQERGWGRVCHISSISALENQGPPSYSAAKASINSYVRGLGRYVAKDGVVVTSLMPGAVLTDGGYWDEAFKERPGHVRNFIEQRMAIGRLGTVSEISSVVSFLVSQDSSFMSGSCILADGGHSRVIQDVESA
jgi:3-oxoacyl-[acyl-carrier protein] reductase